MLGRRSFLISCGSLATGLAQMSPVASRPPRRDANETPTVALYIAGWEAPHNSARSASEGIWISINGSWRTAWR
jgi:hypothetical protein